MHRLLLLPALLAASLPSTASAATASREGETLVYRAEPGEDNRVEVSQQGAVVTFAEGQVGRDPSPTTLDAGPGCEGRDIVTCDAAGVARVLMVLGDESDVARLSDPHGARARASGPLTMAATLEGGSGNDELQGGSGDDLISGGPHADSLLGSAGADVLDGGGGAFDDVAYGGTRPLRITLDDVANDGQAGERDDVRASVEDVVGGNGPDTIVGSAKANQLLGGGGDDVMYGGAGRDRIRGHEGDDRLIGGRGQDLLDGASGSDALFARDGERDKIACRTGSGDRAAVDALDRVYSGCERVRIR
jgi:Ca2+-binding RTX toxin-like protein